MMLKHFPTGFSWCLALVLVAVACFPVLAETVSPDEAVSDFEAAKQSLEKADSDAMGTVVQNAWESDAEFNTRKQSVLDERKTVKQNGLSDAKAHLELYTWVVDPRLVKLQVLPFDRETKIWSISVESKDPAVPFSERIDHSIKDAPDMEKAFAELAGIMKDREKAIADKTLEAEIQYRIHANEAGTYQTIVVGTTLVDTKGGRRVVLEEKPSSRLWTFVAGKRNAPIAYETLEPEITQTAVAFLTALKDADFDAAMKYTTDDAKVLLTMLKMAVSSLTPDQRRQLDEQKGKKLNITNVVRNNKSAKVAYVLGEQPEQWLDLVKQGSTWLVEFKKSM